MKVACIQLSSGENYYKNFDDIIKFTIKAIHKKADLIITPETSGIITSDKKKLFKFSYEMLKDPLIKEIKRIAKKYKKWIVIGSLSIKVSNKLRNRSILIGPKGNIVKYYDKINMFDVKISKKENHNESKTYKAGKKLVTSELPWGKLGFSICYDLRFPEMFRKLSKKKLNFIMVPSAFTKITGKKHWITLLKARAIENFCFIFAPNQTGRNNSKRETFGHSVIISPDGKILKIKKRGKGLILAKINPKQSFELRKIIPSL
ncbi:carbon-nitrogen hydrolase family protein [Candidatus Pelagibacter sp.]|nr:carbon-nitrogen hydrolase family protein [Candidatus Pelagibacter sp.]